MGAEQGQQGALGGTGNAPPAQGATAAAGPPATDATWNTAILERVEVGDVHRLVNLTALASLSGFAIAGVLGMRDAAAVHIEANRNTRYVSQLDAQRDLNTATVRGFVRNGSRWGWRLGALTGLFGVVWTALEKARETSDMWNMAAAGVPPGLIAGFASKGLAGAAKGSIAGCALGLTTGALWTAATLAGHKAREQHHAAASARDASPAEAPADGALSSPAVDDSTSHPEAAIDHAIGAFERAFGTLSNAAADQKQPPPHAKEHHRSEEGIEHSVLAFEHAYVPHPDTAAAAAAATWPSFLGWLWHPSAKPLIPPAPAARQHRGAGPHHHRSEEGIEHAVLAFEHAYVPHPEPHPKTPAS